MKALLLPVHGDDGYASYLAALVLNSDNIQLLRERAVMFGKAREVYPDIYQTSEFASNMLFFANLIATDYDDPIDRIKVEALFEVYGDIEEATVIDADLLPSTSNCRTECDCLEISQVHGLDADFHWSCLLKNTIVILTTEVFALDDLIGECETS